MQGTRLMFYMEAGGFVMWAIAGLSVLGFSIVFERMLFFAANAKNAPDPALFKGPGEERFRAAERAIQALLSDWERHLSFLEVIIRVAPMLGLLGTVLGMVRMFQALAEGGAVTAVAVTSGIQEALFTTVAGLVCAIPLMVAHGLLVARIERQEARLYALLLPPDA